MRFQLPLVRSRPRGVRQELPAAAPGSNVYPSATQWGAVDLPNPSATTVAGLPAANRAKLLITNAVAGMAPMDVWTPDGYRSDERPNILNRPNSVYTCFDFFAMATDQALTHGNFVGLLADFDSDGWAQQIVPIPHGFFIAYFDGAGYLVYAIEGEVYSRDEVVHIRNGGSPNQPMGVGVVTQFRRSWGQALDQQNYAADTYRSGSVPPVLITMDLPEVDQVQAEYVQGQWVRNHGSGSRAPAVIPNTMKITPMSWTPEDIQFLQSREFTIGEIAHIFNMDPSDLGAAFASNSMTYANIEQRQQQRVIDTYSPWMSKFEQEWSDLIPGGNVAKMVPANLLRTDSETLAKVDELQVGTGTRSPNELRKRDGLKPLPKPKPPAAPAVASPGAPGAAGPLDASGNPFSPDPIPGSDIEQTPVKVKA